MQPSVYASADAKWHAVVDEVARLHAQRRPVLIGTRSIEKSERLSELFKQRGLEHDVLNARQIAREAEIVAEAGQPGRITVATNMAGRGTDIKLGDGVAELGGLHVIGTELHDSSRVDRQLEGRCARQGDPGAYHQFMSLDDDVFTVAYGPKKAKRFARQSSANSTATFLRNWRAGRHGLARIHSQPGDFRKALRHAPPRLQTGGDGGRRLKIRIIWIGVARCRLATGYGVVGKWFRFKTERFLIEHFEEKFFLQSINIKRRTHAASSFRVIASNSPDFSAETRSASF